MSKLSEGAELVAHMLAAGVSGYAGNDYVGKLMEQIEAEKDRKQRDKERQAMAAERQKDRDIAAEDREYRRGREAQADRERWSQALAPIMQSLGPDFNAVPSENIPLTEGPDGTLQSAPAGTPTKVKSGNAGVDSILNVLRVPHDQRGEVIEGGATWAAADTAIKNQEFERQLRNKEQTLIRLAPLESELAIKHAVAEAVAMDPINWEKEKRSAALQHRYNLASIAASRSGGDLPTPKDNFEGIAFTEAQNMMDDPTVGMPVLDKAGNHVEDENGNKMYTPYTNAQWRQVLMGRTYQAAHKYGLSMPELGDRTKAINAAVRYYAPSMRRQQTTDVGNELQNAYNVLSTNPTN